MTDNLFILTMRYLNDLYERNAITSEQILKLAEFAASIEENIFKTEQCVVSDNSSKKTVSMNETLKIIHDVFPDDEHTYGRPRNC